jgi:SAM-dependent methyltransferase
MDLSDSFRSNQSEVIAAYLLKLVEDGCVHSLLDVGAGRGKVALTLSRRVERYLAIEKDEANCNDLREAGLDVIQDTFPFPMMERFDLVISSNSLPERGMSLFEPFFAQAWELVSHEGRLAVVTFKGSHSSPIVQLSEEVLGRKPNIDQRFLAVVEILKSFGEVSIGTVRSLVQTKSFADVELLFGSFFWKTEEDKRRIKPRLLRIVEERFADANGFKIPMDHMTLCVSRRQSEH